MWKKSVASIVARLCVRELPPGGVGVPLGRRRDLQRFVDPANRGGADPVAELSSSPWIRWYPQP